MTIYEEQLARYTEAHRRLMGSAPRKRASSGKAMAVEERVPEIAARPPKAIPEPPTPPKRPPIPDDYIPMFLPSRYVGLRPKRSARQIAVEVAERRGLKPHMIFADRRQRDIARARFEAWYLIQQELGLSLTRIGIVFGGYDHGSVHHGIQQHKKRNGIP